MMTKIQRLLKNRTKILTILSISLSTLAEQTDTIYKTRIVSAPINKVWNIILGVDKNSNYLPITCIKKY